MNPRTEVEKTATRRSARRAARELTPVTNVPGSILFASALQSEKKKQKAGIRSRTANRQVAQPDSLPKFGSTSQFGLLGRLISWFRAHVSAANSKELRLTETVQLGEKRFVAIIHVEGRKFLIGGGTAGVNLLTQLDEPAA